MDGLMGPWWPAGHPPRLLQGGGKRAAQGTDLHSAFLMICFIIFDFCEQEDWGNMLRIRKSRVKNPVRADERCRQMIYK